MRSLYRLLLTLLPCWFREEYAEEMLWIFDQTTGNKLPLLLDVAGSAVRQWLGSTLLWQCVLVAGTAPLPYLFGLQVWKGLKPVTRAQSVSQEPLLGIAEIAIVVAAFLICLFGVAGLRHAFRPRRVIGGSPVGIHAAGEISISLATVVGSGTGSPNSRSVVRCPSIASRILRSVCSRVGPVVIQPGKSGT